MRTVPRAVFSYLRVSSAGQERDGTSLEGQQQAHLRYCAEKGFPPPTFFIEVESGSDTAIEKREEQLRLQREAFPGTLVLVTLLDRWSRDVPHSILSSRALIARDIGWVAFQDGIDASTRDGQLMLQYRAIAAEQERIRIRDRTLGRRRELTDAGFYVGGTTPLGYVRTRERRLVVVPEEAAIVVDIFERSAGGESLADITSSMPDVRKRTRWTVKSVHTVLRSRYVLGEMRRYDGTWVAESHPAIVSRDLWDRAHAALRKRVAGGRKYTQGDSARRLLRGIAACSACGRLVSVRFGSPRQGNDGDGMRVHYYVCRGVLTGEGCAEGWNRAHPIDAEASKLALARLEELREELSKPAPAAPKRKATDAADHLARVEARRRKVVDLFLSDGIDRPEMDRRVALLDEEAAKHRSQAAREKAAAAAAASAADPARRATLLKNVRAIRASWSRFSVEKRQNALAALAHRVEIGRSGVRFEWRSAVELDGAWTERRRISQP